MTKLIPLTGKQGQGKFTLVDDVDYPDLLKYKWHLAKNGYVYRRGDNGQRTVYIHRQILKAPSNMDVDHMDKDKLNNTKANIRLVTTTQNLRNARPWKKATSKYKGVMWSDQQWRAKIQVDGEQIELGYFLTQREAAIAYNEAALKYFGEFAWLNPIPEMPELDDQPIQKPEVKQSRFRGVCWDYRRQKWSAKTKTNGRFINIGRFINEVEAAKAYDRIARQYHGVNAKLNFPNQV